MMLFYSRSRGLQRDFTIVNFLTTGMKFLEETVTPTPLSKLKVAA